MGTLHTVTQLRPFVLSGDGAFLPIAKDSENEFVLRFTEQMKMQQGLSRVPANIQDVDGHLDVFGMNTIHREHEVNASGKFLHIESGGKHGYDTELLNLINSLSIYLGDFWFFVLYNNRHADEYLRSNGKITISRELKLPVNDYDSYICERLCDNPVLRQAYLLETGLDTKRSYQAYLEEYGRLESELVVEDFPDAIKTLKKALAINPDNRKVVAAIQWYEHYLDKSNR